MQTHILAAKLMVCLAALALLTTSQARAQEPSESQSAASPSSLDDLNVQFHGFATQGLIYTNNNSWNTTDSSNGSAAWTETVVNLTAEPQPNLRVAVQARYFLLGDYGNAITLDYAMADLKLDERLGLRVGKVKTPIGLFNESQDIDPAHLWVLLPQSIYPIDSRTSLLSHYGGIAYGTVALGESFGKLEYRAFGGQRVIGASDGVFQGFRDAGLTVPNGITGHIFGGTLRWNAPVRGLLFGASEISGPAAGELAAGPLTGTLDVPRLRQTFFFSRFERNRVMLAGEYSRFLSLLDVQLDGQPDNIHHVDDRSWYVMATYRISSKLSGGLYYSSQTPAKTPDVPNFQKDWNVAARYDFNSFLYAKAEQHWIDGTALGFNASDNPNLQSTTRMSLFKLGVSF